MGNKEWAIVWGVVFIAGLALASPAALPAAMLCVSAIGAVICTFEAGRDDERIAERLRQEEKEEREE